VEDFFHGGNGVGYCVDDLKDKLKLYSFYCENAKSKRDFHGIILTVGRMALLLKMEKQMVLSYKEKEKWPDYI
jgi:hypothetical protein